MAILSIDAGTTGVTALIMSERGEGLAKGYREFPQYFPMPGWVEHDPEEIWQATLAAVGEALASAKQPISAIGITNQRETVVLWDRATLTSPRKAIVWQDRRTSPLVVELVNAGHEEQIKAKTGLGLDPYFSSTKLLWLAKNEPDLWVEVKSGRFAVGTVDSYLVARLTGGKSHITDATNASRTQLMNISTAKWDPELLRIFDVPEDALPKIVPSYGLLATTDPEHFLDLSVPISGIAGDQQAALFGQTGFEIGDNKCTYGTGAFILTNTGEQRKSSSHGLLTTIAWMEPDGKITYALEGSVFVAGAAVQWLRDGLQIIEKSAEVEALAESVPDTNGVLFVPALTGLGAPFWDPYARGTILGITRGTTKAHMARATLEAIAYQIRAVSDAIRADTGSKLESFRVDGGAAANNFLMQFQADSLGIPVIRGANLESTAIGAAFLAGLGVGIWKSKEELKSIFRTDRVFEPGQFNEWNYINWQRAVKVSSGWATQNS